MFRNARVLQVTCVTACLVMLPWTSVFGGERQEPIAEQAQTQPVPASIRDGIRKGAFGLATPDVPSFPLASRYALRGGQSVATTTESKLLLGITAGALIVGGMSLMAYGATSTCKGSEGASTSACEKKALIGAMTLSGGAAMLVLWALSRS